VDQDPLDPLAGWLLSRGRISVGAMGTRAKQAAENYRIHLDFTYGVIDKCILKALLGEDSLILTTGSMVKRVHHRIDSYGRESGIRIPVRPCAPGFHDVESREGNVP
jgi:cobalt/nickel transport system ATP-binding protein